MAQTAANILIGAATVYLDTYESAGSEASPATEVGHTNGPTTFSPTFQDYEVKSEQALATIKRVPIDFGMTVKVPIIEATLEHMQKILRQPSANLTGDGSATPKVLLIDSPTEVYYQVKLAGPGLGNAGTREVVLWRCIVTELAEIQLAKSQEQVLMVTLQALYDDTVSTDGKFGKITDAEA